MAVRLLRPRRAGGRLLVTAALVVLAAVVAVTPAMRALERQGIDLLLPFAAVLGFEARPLPDRPPVAIVAIREETYRDPDFADRPRIAWNPQMAAVLAGIAEGGAAVIGFDVIYATTLDRPELIPGFDRLFNEVLIAIAAADRLVLGYVQSAELPVMPVAVQVAAVGAENLRPVNLLTDGDDVVRRVPASFPGEWGPVPSFAAELVRRGGGRIADDAVPLIDPTIAAADIPIYEFADLWRCAAAGDLDFFRSAFAGRVVILGTILDIEDRRLTARRLMGDVADHAPEARCTPGGDASTRVARPTTPGAVIHAVAATTLLLDRAPVVPSAIATGAIVGGVTLAGAGLAFALPPLLGGTALLLLILLTGVAGAAALMQGLLLPVPQVALACAALFALVYAYRFMIEDRTRRRIVTAFRHYLAPALVDRLSETADGLKLGGEVREVTVLFADLAGFTALAERLVDRPQDLVALTNERLTIIAETIERHGGYVDKFIGDAVMGVWGAPLPDPDAPLHALAAAAEIRARLAAVPPPAGEAGGQGAREAARRTAGEAQVRIGVNGGAAVLGNVGSPTRFNYTVLGDAVNLAARLEQANRDYGTAILVGEATRRALPPALRRDGLPGIGRLRRIDRIAVRGRQRPVRLYELVVPGALDGSALDDFRDALALRIRGRTAEATARLATLAPRDPVAAVWLARTGGAADRSP